MCIDSMICTTEQVYPHSQQSPHHRRHGMQDIDDKHIETYGNLIILVTCCNCGSQINSTIEAACMAFLRTATHSKDITRVLLLPPIPPHFTPLHSSPSHHCTKPSPPSPSVTFSPPPSPHHPQIMENKSTHNMYIKLLVLLPWTLDIVSLTQSVAKSLFTFT